MSCIPRLLWEHYNNFTVMGQRVSVVEHKSHWEDIQRKDSWRHAWLLETIHWINQRCSGLCTGLNMQCLSHSVPRRFSTNKILPHLHILYIIACSKSITELVLYMPAIVCATLWKHFPHWQEAEIKAQLWETFKCITCSRAVPALQGLIARLGDTEKKIDLPDPLRC